jgi:hypothetical protein
MFFSIFRLNLRWAAARAAGVASLATNGAMRETMRA